jgi:acetylornithine deacetylase/succinyl-diaminopimelate desuccinylase-like protein
MPTRREFVQRVSAAAAGTWLGARVDDRLPRADGARLRAHLEALSAFGRPAGGAFAHGVTRLGYSEADVQGREFVNGLMKSAGLTPRIDAAGNIFARRDGADASLPPILFGSHIDSVRTAATSTAISDRSPRSRPSAASARRA